MPQWILADTVKQIGGEGVIVNNVHVVDYKEVADPATGARCAVPCCGVPCCAAAGNGRPAGGRAMRAQGRRVQASKQAVERRVSPAAAPRPRHARRQEEGAGDLQGRAGV